MGFQTPQHPLRELLPKLRKGEIQLPDFQRGYVWEVEQVRELLVSIARGHPMGVVMTLQLDSAPGMESDAQYTGIPENIIVLAEEILSSMKPLPEPR